MGLFQLVCNIIILLGGVLISIKTIFEWIGKPIRLAKNHNDAVLEEKIHQVLDRVLPGILFNHDLETKARYLSDRERYLQEIKAAVLTEMQGQIGAIDKLTEQYEALAISAKDVLREKIMQIYFQNVSDKQLTEHEKEALTQYYKDYKAMKGNSYIDKYYGRMSTWKVVADDYDEQCAL